MEHARRAELEPYVTRDGSTIREWAGPGYTAEARGLSLAEATVAPGASTVEHLHRRSEELYLVTAGSGTLQVGDEEREVRVGDCVAIPPGTAHRLRNDGDVDLVVVCACSPPYSHEDTVLLQDEGGVTVRVREARPGEELAVARIHVRSWQEAYADLMPAEFLAALDPRDRAARYTFGTRGPEAPTTLVAVYTDVEAGIDGGGAGEEALLGFVTFVASRDVDAPGLGEIAALYVDPDRLGRGVGRLLMAEARRRLREEGFTEALLWVLDGNDRARVFYEAEGWRPDGARREENPYDIVSQVSRFRRSL